MKITNLSIRNFRGIREMLIQPDDNINLIIGENGAGKSTILDAISYLLSWFAARIGNLKGNGTVIKQGDIYIGEKDTEINITIDAGQDKVIKWSLYGSNSKLEKSGKTDLTEMMSYVKSLIVLNDNKELLSVPVISYYKVNRSVTDIPLRVKNLSFDNIFEIYKSAFDNKTGFREFFSWYRNREDLESQRIRYENAGEDRQLSAVREALGTFFPHYKNLHVRRNPQSMVLEKDGKLFNLNQLSDGELCYLSLISDISRKLVIANPQSNKPLHGNGVVLLDEIELHLHPTWQREVIGKLKEVFPNIQFFITTHSPLVVSNISKDQLILMKDGERIQKYSFTFGKKVNDILIDFFNLSAPRGLEMEKLIENAKSAIRLDDKTTYQALMNEIESYLPPSDRDVISLNLESKRKWD